jgi:hypothetical protein
MARWAVPVAVVLVIFAFVATPALARKKPTEYGTWNVRVTPDSDAAARGEKAAKDTLLLQQGVFRSEAWYMYGFTSAGYKVHGSDFSVDTESRQNGKIRWTGLITGDSIAGRMVWTRKDGTVLNYTFFGTRAEVEKSKKKKH